MSSRVKRLTGHLIARLLDEHVQREHATYQPWLKVADAPSKDTSAVMTGRAHGRPHHVPSQDEPSTSCHWSGATYPRYPQMHSATQFGIAYNLLYSPRMKRGLMQ
jgi:hypothetical protein